LDCEKTWNKFRKSVVVNQNDSDERSRYQRINPVIGRDPPGLDAKKEIDQLQLDVKSYFHSNECKLMIDDVVLRLIASTFYFEKKDQHFSRDLTGAYFFRGI
jgi:hypothetical protein